MATVAIHSDGRILQCLSCDKVRRADAPFHWCNYRLTEYGRLYAKQRGLI